MISGAFHLAASGACVIPRVWWARGFRERTRGLLGRAALTADEGLWLVPCGAVHTLGMGYPLDLIYLDRALRVVKVARGVVPGRISWGRGAHSTLELAAGGGERFNLQPGVELAWRCGA